MLIEYEDLVKQLAQFRLDVINALADINVEIDALQRAATAKQPILAESLKRLRADSRQRLLHKFQEHHSQRLALLHEDR